jgi:hypothetical protein
MSPPTTPPEPASSCSCWVEEEEEEEEEARLWVYKGFVQGAQVDSFVIASAKRGDIRNEWQVVTLHLFVVV